MVENIIILVSFSEHYTFNETLFNLKCNKPKLNTRIFSIGLKNDYFQHDLNILKNLSFFKKIDLITSFINKIVNVSDNVNGKIVFVSSNLLNLFIAFKFRGIFKNIHIIHDFKPHLGEKNYFKILIYNYLILLFSDNILTHSNYTYKEINRVTKFFSKKIKIFPLTRTFQKITPINLDYKKVLFFGRLNYYKGLKFLPFIIKNNPDVEFIIAGKIQEKFKQYISKEIGFFSNTRIVDKVINISEMNSLFKECNLVILPYISASQSGVIVDAYKFSRPVIAFNVGALSEQIIDNSTGFLISKNDIVGFSNLIKSYYLLKPNKIRRLSKNAWNYGYLNYSAKLNTSKFIDGLLNL